MEGRLPDFRHAPKEPHGSLQGPRPRLARPPAVLGPPTGLDLEGPSHPGDLRANPHSVLPGECSQHQLLLLDSKLGVGEDMEKKKSWGGAGFEGLRFLYVNFPDMSNLPGT